MLSLRKWFINERLHQPPGYIEYLYLRRLCRCYAKPDGGGWIEGVRVRIAKAAIFSSTASIAQPV